MFRGLTSEFVHPYPFFEAAHASPHVVSPTEDGRAVTSPPKITAPDGLSTLVITQEVTAFISVIDERLGI
jgi:hypothetical protein